MMWVLGTRKSTQLMQGRRFDQRGGFMQRDIISLVDGDSRMPLMQEKCLCYGDLRRGLLLLRSHHAK